jgi:hypothetical protein
MSTIPNGTGAFSAGYSPGPLPGLPTSSDDKYADGTTYSRARNALILGLLAIPLGILTGIPAIFVGAHALRHIGDSDGALQGRRIAWCGIVLGSLSVAAFITVLYLVYR